MSYHFVSEIPNCC